MRHANQVADQWRHCRTPAPSRPCLVIERGVARRKGSGTWAVGSRSPVASLRAHVRDNTRSKIRLASAHDVSYCRCEPAVRRRARQFLRHWHSKAASVVMRCAWMRSLPKVGEALDDGVSCMHHRPTCALCLCGDWPSVDAVAEAAWPKRGARPRPHT